MLKYTATISPKQIENLTENVTVLRIVPFCVAALQQMPPQPIPHYHQAGQATEKIRSPDPERFHAFLLRVYSSMFDRSKDKMCVIIRLMVARNDLTGVFLDRHGWFARPLWQSLRYLGSPVLWPALFVYSISIRLKLEQLKTAKIELGFSSQCGEEKSKTQP